MKHVWLMYQFAVWVACVHARALRLQSFPRGLGKGSDAALVGAWLQTVMADLDETMVPATW